MTDRDRLIELFKKIKYTPFPEMTMKAKFTDQFTDYALNSIADDLLANGVTVQEWISTKDRLPEDISPVLFYTPVPSFEIGYYDGVEWLRGDVWYERDEVTHWMPLPKPPKGVRS